MSINTSINLLDNIILENERVLLRLLKQNDLENLLNFALSEPEIWKYSLIAVNGKEGLEDYIKMALAAKETQKEFPFIVFDKLSGKYAGSTRFYDIQTNYKSLQVGYTWYGKDFQGTGLNKHCKFLLLQYAFETLQMERVEFRADNNNKRSIAAMKSIGCIVDGVLRSNVPISTGGRRDSIILSILKEEWENKIKEELKSKLQY